MSVVFQGFGGDLTDREVYEAELGLARQAEPLGFESIWSVEHHFTNYTMVPDVVQFLTYMAGCTEKVGLGSMVAVLPWHDPIRLAEQIAMLDNLSGGRVILGLGRGTGKVEFDGFRVDMSEARARFVESADMILEGLESGTVEYDGEFVKQPRTDLRPAPYKSFRGRTYAATVSPESAEIMARMGVGVLIVPQKPWNMVEEELSTYRDTYRAATGEEAPPPICAGWVFVDPSEDRAEEMARRYIGGYWDSIIEHYEFDKDHLKHTPGYEFHGLMYDRLQKPGGMEKMTDFYVNLQAFGTPEQVFEKIVNLSNHTYMDSFIGVFRYAGMPVSDAEANMQLFAREVMPELQALAPVHDRLGMPV